MLEDFKGLKIRMPGLGGEVLKRIGAVPVSLPGTKIFSSLQSGALDATEWAGPWNDLTLGFYKVAMRPGKPLMAGRLGDAMMLGLPGNPVSAMVCGHVFLAPVIRAMIGLAAAPAPRITAPLAAGIATNGPREHYMRATLTPQGILPFAAQDSALLHVLSRADALLVRPPRDGARKAGEMAEYISLQS